MKNLFTLLTAILLSINLYAQNANAIIFTENGERFQVVLNGVIQNTEPGTNIKLTELVAPQYKLKIIFEDKSLGEVNKNFYLEPGAEVTYNLKRKNNGEWALRVISSTPIAQLPPSSTPVPNQNVVIYHSTPVPAASTTTTTTTTTYTDPNSNVNLNIGLGGVGLNMNVTGTGVGTSTTQTTTSYSTTTTTSVPPTHIHQTPPPNSTTTVVIHEHEPEHIHVVPGYSGPTGCPYPMSDQDYNGIKNSIMSKSFESTKFDIAKQVLGQRCMTAAQVKDILGVFDFESTKLDFAKFAYGRTYDVGNYYMVNDVFDFESSITDLNRYISSYRR